MQFYYPLYPQRCLVVYSRQTLPPPDGTSNTPDNQPGGGAPIGGGLFILLGMSTVYSIKKVYQDNKNENE